MPAATNIDGTNHVVIVNPDKSVLAEYRLKQGELELERAKLRVGIYWAAMPGQLLDRQRSAPFAQFLALAGDPELLVFSLQGGVRYYLEAPDSGAEWGLRFTFSLLYPRK